MTAPRYTAFVGHSRIASGPAMKVAGAVLVALEAGHSRVLIFNDASGEQVELDLSGPVPAIADRSAPPKPGRGRPKLGVVPREVTLLPRHWEWLAAQPGGASAALRRLVEAASRTSAGAETQRRRREAAYRVATALAGDLPGYEEAMRALFAGDADRFAQLLLTWPGPVRHFLQRVGPREGAPSSPVAGASLPPPIRAR